ncbi:TIGR02285 family protein [Aquipseudomonas campi]|uniref:TIGR02285 family protein n=1 Tax=Aquipseudomonas campi TaxID=2731681 RepID=A0A6M8FAW5_9GAMM|nr:TIGR02285 family protein [Pseudomonas campi]QKE62017.1 TIGR02285 family protein [Pseudomonas campi]
MPARLLRTLLVFSLLTLGAELRAEPQEIVWGTNPWPGLVNLRDGQPHSGIIIDLLKQVTERLPQYRHRLQLVNLSRGLEQLKQPGTTCLLPTIRTPERDQLGHFVGLFVAMPHQLLVRSSDQARLAAGQSEVSLRALLQDSQLRGGLIQDRSYGPNLDSLLNDPAVQPQLLRIQTSSAGNNLFDMLAHGRIDYLLEYAEVTQFVQQQGAAQGLSLLPLQEASTPLVSGIYCSRTPEGAELVRQIDQIARQPAVIAYFQQAQKAYVPATTLQHYQAWLDQFFAQRGQSNLTSLPH